MFRPGTVGEADYSPPQSSANTLSKISQQIPPTGKIQRIFQEGSKSKNTYVIIVNNDNVGQKSEHGEKNTFSKSDSTQVNVKMAESKHAILSDTNRLLNEDVKLNLTNICDDDEYDSGLSSSNVFLKPDTFETAPYHGQDNEDDSAIAMDTSSDTNSNLKPESETKTDMNAQSLSATKRSKRGSKSQKHNFPVTSQPFLGCQSQLAGKLAYTTPSSSSTTKFPNHQAARKIFLVTPTSSSQSSGGSLKKSVAYTNDAVPTVNSRSKYQTVQAPVTVVPRPNPKAVPTASNMHMSPIQNLTNTSPESKNLMSGVNYSHMPMCSSPNYLIGGKGPLTSTPIYNEVPRISHLKQEAGCQRHYIISSPFASSGSSSQCESTQQFSSPSFSTPQSRANRTDSPVFCDSSVHFNESSGYVSNSGSLEFSVTPGSTENSTDCPSPITIDEEISTARIEDGQVVSCGTSKSGNKQSCEFVQEGEIFVKVEDMNMQVQEAFGRKDVDSDHSVSSSQESNCENTGKECLNKSLTNIQWLKHSLGIKEEKTTAQPARSTTSTSHSQPINWRRLSQSEIRKISDECGLEKRPPFSYMTMITMALQSRADRKMMLKEICKWIEDMFPYYKFTAKPGWKNSIRHNLSLYNIFVREPVRRHGSYWTIKPDCEPKTKQYKDRSNSHHDKHSLHQSTPSMSSTTPGMIPIIPMYSSMGALSAISPQAFPIQAGAGMKKKGLMPILPRPTPLGSVPQAYALIPIQNVNQPFSVSGQGQQQVIVQVPQSSTGGSISACPSPGINEVSAAVASIQVSSASPIPQEFIDGQFSPMILDQGSMNIVRQAWVDSQQIEAASSIDSDLASSSELVSVSSTDRAKSKRPRGKPELPKPKFYKKETTAKKTKCHSKRRKLVQKERKLDDSSDEDDDVAQFLSNLQPPKSKESLESLEVMLTTSTPLKTDDHNSAPQLPSPIHGFTPLRGGNLFDGSFLETLTQGPDGKVLGLSPDCHGLRHGSDISPKLLKVTNSSLLDSLMLPTLNTPEKEDGSPGSNTSLSNHNLSRFLSEYGLDPNMVDAGENFTDLNWSSIQQIVDTMDSG